MKPNGQRVGVQAQQYCVLVTDVRQRLYDDDRCGGPERVLTTGTCSHAEKSSWHFVEASAALPFDAMTVCLSVRDHIPQWPQLERLHQHPTKEYKPVNSIFFFCTVYQ